MPLRQDDIDVRVQSAQLIEHGIAIHHRQEEIQDHEADVFSDLLVNP